MIDVILLFPPTMKSIVISRLDPLIGGSGAWFTSFGITISTGDGNDCAVAVKPAKEIAKIVAHGRGGKWKWDMIAPNEPS